MLVDNSALYKRDLFQKKTFCLVHCVILRHFLITGCWSQTDMKHLFKKINLII